MNRYRKPLVVAGAPEVRGSMKMLGSAQFAWLVLLLSQ